MAKKTALAAPEPDPPSERLKKVSEDLNKATAELGVLVDELRRAFEENK